MNTMPPAPPKLPFFRNTSRLAFGTAALIGCALIVSGLYFRLHVDRSASVEVLNGQATTVSSRSSIQAKLIDALRQQVYADYPELAGEELDDLTRVTLLRQWAWSRIRVGRGSIGEGLDNNLANFSHRLDAPAMFALYESDQGCTKCGGSAHFLQKLYEEFGYQAWTYNSGVPGHSHVTTLVKIRFGSDDVICVQDAHFNITHVESTTGKPLDFFKLLAALARSDHASIKTLEADYKNLPGPPSVLFTAPDSSSVTPDLIRGYVKEWWPILEDDYECTQIAEGRFKITSPRSFAKFLRCNRNPDGTPTAYLKWLVQQGHPAEMVYLYLHPLNLGGAGGRQALWERVQSFTKIAPRAKSRDEAMAH